MGRVDKAIFLGAAMTSAAAALLMSPAPASETVTYRYDARGRLVKVTHAGSVNNNVATNYAYDKADNRTAKTTAGAPK